MTRRWPFFGATTLCCLLTLATSASAEEPSQERAKAIREQARAAAERAREQAVRVNLRWLLLSEETVMVAEAPGKQGAGMRGGEKCASGGRQDAWLYGQ